MDKKKKLYNTQNVYELITNGANEIEADSNIIFTPSAMDILRENGIKVICKKCCSESGSFVNRDKSANDKNIVENLTNLLVNKYNIKDENVIKKIIVAVLKEIN